MLIIIGTFIACGIIILIVMLISTIGLPLKKEESVVNTVGFLLILGIIVLLVGGFAGIAQEEKIHQEKCMKNGDCQDYQIDQEWNNSNHMFPKGNPLNP